VSKIRVRFAPSPTGPLHIGGLRTALFNYLFAKKNDGSFLVRIEDTDKKREVPGAEEYIFKALDWCGIQVDEKTSDNSHRQSSRKELYQAKAKELVKKGLAYYAFDSEQELLGLREKSIKKKEVFIYNWKTREGLKNSLTLGEEEVNSMINRGNAYVIRFLCPRNKSVITNDLIRGAGNIDSSLIDDKVLIKADGMPTYHFANVVDDYMMKISHVIRGEEWLPSLALHILLYKAFDWEPPKFAHLPLILNPNGKGKLSKRSADKSGFPLFPLSWKKENTSGFKEAGFLPAALNNYMASLGWAAEVDKEIMDMDELIKNFKLGNVVSAAANFNIKRLKWVNHKHITKTPDEELYHEIATFFPKTKTLAKTQVLIAISLVKERAETIYDFWALIKYLFYAPEAFDENAILKFSEKKILILDQINRLAAGIKDKQRFEFAEEFINNCLAWGKRDNIKAAKIMTALRVALVGDLQGIEIKKIVSFVGINEVCSRVEKLRSYVS
tara:strand:+ start:1160 stop:2656 length:1497 start_codon:yes stop_codon:yes gene_type:complete